MVTVLALDLGSTMGAMGFGFNRPISMEFGKPKTPNRPLKLAHTYQWLDAMLAAGVPGQPMKFEIVAYERPFCRGMDATRMGWGLAGIIEAVAFKHGAKLFDATPQEVKLFWAGTGAASKEQMITAAILHGFPGLNEHEADALAMYEFTRAHPDPLRRAQYGKTYERRFEKGKRQKRRIKRNASK